MTLRRKLWLGFGGMLAILLTIAVIGIAVLNRYSRTLEQIFRENYDSVAAMEKSKDALNHLDTAALLAAWKSANDGERLSKDYRSRFEESLKFQRSNITLPNETDLTVHLAGLWEQYRNEHTRIFGMQQADAQHHYIDVLIPLSQRLNAAAQTIADANLKNMVSVDGQVRQIAQQARNALYLLLAVGVIFAVAYATFFGTTILRPLESLTQSAKEIGRGNLDLVVQSSSKDEVGQLGDAFNSMAASLREFRRSNQARLLRTQQTTQHAINTLHDAVVVLGVGGQIEIANDTARRRFNLEPGKNVDELKIGWLANLHRHVCQTERPFEPRGYENAIQVFVDGDERFFLPHALPMLDEARRLIGVIVVLADVTQLRRLDEMKSGLVSTVSHELRTPLTSIRMAVHLLLEEKVGGLTSKQAELLLAARDDSTRLNQIIENLLDISRIESGRVRMDLAPTSVEKLVTDAVEASRASYEAKGVELKSALPEDLPPVAVDRARIAQVFSNLLNNALKYTPAGGRVSITAAPMKDNVVFMVSDTGVGIPEAYLKRIFEKFFRVPGQGAESGAGLGLAIARDIVEAHGGSIQVASEEGKGTAFSFQLKMADKEGRAV
jgi:two-component system, NtrC family, sensor histidine kinase KinB